MAIYKAYGLVVESEIELYEAEQVKENVSAEVKIELGVMPAFIKEHKRIGYHNAYRGNTMRWLNFPQQADYLIENGENITVELEPEGEKEEYKNIRDALLGPCLGEILFQKGVLAIHGSAISYGESAIIISGHSGSGKSTITRALLNEGYDFMADDIVAIEQIDRKFYAMPGYPQQKLCRDVAIKNNFDVEKLQRVDDEREKYTISLRDCYNNKRTEVKLYVVLEIVDNIQLTIEQVTGARVLKYVINNLFHAQRYKTLSMDPEIFTKCTELAKCIKVISVKRPREGDTVETIINHIKKYILEDKICQQFGE